MRSLDFASLDFELGAGVGAAHEELSLEDTALFPVTATPFVSYTTRTVGLRVATDGAQDANSERRWLRTQLQGALRIGLTERHTIATQLWAGHASRDTPVHHLWSIATARGVRAPLTPELVGRTAARGTIEYRWHALATDLGATDLDAELALFGDAGATERGVIVAAVGPAFRVSTGAPLGLDLAVELGVSTIGEQLFVTTERAF